MAKKFPAPLSFVIVVAAVVAVCIFFGAWAVSVDAADQDRALTIGANNIRVDLMVADLRLQTDGVTGETLLDEESSANTWWGSSLLMACPLH